MKFRPLHDGVVIRRGEGNGTSKGVVHVIEVVRSAPQDARSIAALLVTTEAMAADIPHEEAPTASAE